MLSNLESFRNLHMKNFNITLMGKCPKKIRLDSEWFKCIWKSPRSTRLVHKKFFVSNLNTAFRTSLIFFIDENIFDFYLFSCPTSASMMYYLWSHFRLGRIKSKMIYWKVAQNWKDKHRQTLLILGNGSRFLGILFLESSFSAES